MKTLDARKETLANLRAAWSTNRYCDIVTHLTEAQHRALRVAAFLKTVTIGYNVLLGCQVRLYPGVVKALEDRNFLFRIGHDPDSGRAKYKITEGGEDTALLVGPYKLSTRTV